MSAMHNALAGQARMAIEAAAYAALALAAVETLVVPRRHRGRMGDFAVGKTAGRGSS
jgi:hypothetical protein